MNEFKSAIDRRLADVRMDEAMKRRILKKVEEDSMKKRYKFSGALLVAVLLALALAATGLAAAARWGLIDFFGDAAEPILSNEQVKEQIRTDLGSASDDDIRLTLREAIFDGYGLQLLLDVAPTDPSKLTLSASNADAGGETATTSTSGHLEITDDPAVTLFTSGIDTDSAYLESLAREEDGHLLYWCYLWFAQDLPDTLSGAISLRARPDGDALSIPFTLTRTGLFQRARLIPETENALCDIVSAQIAYTDVAAYFTVDYTMKRLPEKAESPTPDPEATYYATQSGRYYHSVADCCGMEGATAFTGAEIAKTEKCACPVCLNAPVQRDTLAYNLTILPTDAEGKPLPSRGGAANEATLENGEKVYRQVWCLQTDTALPDNFQLQVTLEEEDPQTILIPCQTEVIRP